MNISRVQLVLGLFYAFTLVTFSQQKNSQLFDIARHGSLQELKEVLNDRPLQIDTPNARGYTPLMLACYYSNVEVAKHLIDHLQSLDTNSGYGTALMAATVKGNNDLVIYLLEHGANPNITDGNGTTALHYAVMFNLEIIASKLIDAGAKSDLEDNRGNTAKDYALIKNNKKLLTLFNL